MGVWELQDCRLLRGLFGRFLRRFRGSGWLLRFDHAINDLEAESIARGFIRQIFRFPNGADTLPGQANGGCECSVVQSSLHLVDVLCELVEFDIFRHVVYLSKQFLANARNNLLRR